ncbi:hypothetical protein DACRYDRAFT_119476 [Dacryopinax primogenitus]|uniref:Uncharacterized protein n=1 Tax=Dacryopinax primogenitus (strain DJM 731) TaxID=1858805 RepID=M5FVK1_DACPD|nr:uncharacterized protein DACRYDRAFT_119476 [Dacryopinax primogenitus]EJT97366.1 hypothetical protein DACRYDRAFT_119476 [Dacryopinax primogenitus]
MSTPHSSLPSALQGLFSRSPLPPLRPSKPYDSALTPVITGLSSQYPASVISGLHLLNDDIDNAHTVAQAHEGDQSCDTWHAFLHRREGDYWNSGWWIARLSHPLLLKFANAESMSKAKADAKSFVSACERIGMGRSEGEILEKRQYDQLRELCDWDIEHAK